MSIETWSFLGLLVANVVLYVLNFRKSRALARIEADLFCREVEVVRREVEQAIQTSPRRGGA